MLSFSCSCYSHETAMFESGTIIFLRDPSAPSTDDFQIFESPDVDVLDEVDELFVTGDPVGRVGAEDGHGTECLPFPLPFPLPIVFSCEFKPFPLP
mmetsp:Transcript_23167/g.22236  ORF Transcript_23167/g.22236 Transcript_23167/m.22236 type:complete len:96 (-) Transcript_23167:335-622(-)